MKTKWLFEEFVESKSNILNLSTFNFVRILSNNKIINPDDENANYIKSNVVWYSLTLW